MTYSTLTLSEEVLRNDYSSLENWQNDEFQTWLSYWQDDRFYIVIGIKDKKPVEVVTYFGKYYDGQQDEIIRKFTAFRQMNDTIQDRIDGHKTALLYVEGNIRFLAENPDSQGVFDLSKWHALVEHHRLCIEELQELLK
jgi:hypothetical protein